MTQAMAHILEEVGQLSALERAELADRLVESLARDIPPDIELAQLEEVQNRVAEVERGAVTLIPGDQVLEQVRMSIATSTRRTN